MSFYCFLIYTFYLVLHLLYLSLWAMFLRLGKEKWNYIKLGSSSNTKSEITTLVGKILSRSKFLVVQRNRLLLSPKIKNKKQKQID